MTSKFEKVMANLRESLAHATPEEDGQPSYCMVRKDELEALTWCVAALVGIRQGSWRHAPMAADALERLEACAETK